MALETTSHRRINKLSHFPAGASAWRSRTGVRCGKLFSTGREHDFLVQILSVQKLTMNEAKIITIGRKAFWDIGHAPEDQSNRRKYLPGYCEISL
jgi:hypothetical protein